MDDTRFDGLVKQLTRQGESRRGLLRGFAATGIGLGVARLPLLVTAQVRKTKGKGKANPKKPKSKPNQYGCLEVGDPCKRDGQCCSSLCKGKPGKKTCRAHDTGTCNQRAGGTCSADNPDTLHCNSDLDCYCFRTTAGSKFCGNWVGYKTCADCQKDADCEALGMPPGSACVPVANGQCAGAMCESGMACMAPCGVDPPDPPAA